MCIRVWGGARRPMGPKVLFGPIGKQAISHVRRSATAHRPHHLAPSTMPTLQLFQRSWCIADAPPARAATLSVLLERCGRPSDDPNCLHHDDDAKPREHVRRRACSSCDLLSRARLLCRVSKLYALQYACSRLLALRAGCAQRWSCQLHSSRSQFRCRTGSFFEVVERAANGCALGAGAATRKVKY